MHKANCLIQLLKNLIIVIVVKSDKVINIDNDNVNKVKKKFKNLTKFKKLEYLKKIAIFS